MLKLVSWFEILAAMALVGLAVWPFSGFCSGRFMGLDCETRAIFAVNMFGPAGVLALACSVWSLKTGSLVPQFVLGAGIAAVLLYWVTHAF